MFSLVLLALLHIWIASTLKTVKTNVCNVTLLLHMPLKFSKMSNGRRTAYLLKGLSVNHPIVANIVALGECANLEMVLLVATTKSVTSRVLLQMCALQELLVCNSLIQML